MPAKTYVLDSYALLVLLEDQPGADRVSEIIAQEQANKYMSVINLGEVLYLVERRRSARAAIEIREAVAANADIRLVDATLDRVQSAASAKAKGGLSYADCFAVALAKEVGGTLVTGDPEFSQVESEMTIEWLPRTTQ